MITTIPKSIDTIVIIDTTSSSITLSLMGIGLKIIPISNSIACGLTISDEVSYEIVMQKHNNYKKQYEKGKENFKSFDEIYRKSLQENLIDKKEYESLGKTFTE